MNTLNKRYIWTFFLILLAVMVAAYLFNVYGNSPNPKYYRSDSESIECVTVRDSEGNIIFQTGEPVHVEDEYINENNQHYIVTKVSGSEGIAEIKTQVTQAPGPDSKGDTIFSGDFYDQSLPAVAEPQNIHVVIYHTHSDESYIPTSGTASEPGKGDVLDIGKALQSALQKEGISVTHSDKLHDPHDINAYHRSRAI
jgi:stage II sporulation protein P